MKTALTVLGVTLISEELQELFERFNDGGDGFAYLNCVREVELRTQQAAAAAAATKNSSGTAAAQVLAGLKGFRCEEEAESPLPLQDPETDEIPAASPSGQQEHTYKDAARRAEIVRNFHGMVQKRVKTGGYDLIDAFEKYSRYRTVRPGHVSPMIFRRALEAVGIRMTDEQLAALREIYGGVRGGVEEVNYVDFCAVVDPDNARGTTSAALNRLLKKHVPVPPPRKQGGSSKYFDRQGRVRPYVGAKPRPRSAGFGGGMTMRPIGIAG